MNLFRSEEHLRRWPLFSQAFDDYVMPVTDWASVFSGSMFRRRLDPDYLDRGAEYLKDYREALKAMGKATPAPDRVLSTVMFTDIVDSTGHAAASGDAAWRSLLERHDELVRSQIKHFGGREIKHTGDGFLSAFDGPGRAIGCARAICSSVTDVGLHVRAGVHSGECEVLGDDLGGIAVHIASRITSAAAADEILVSRAVKDAVTGSGIEFATQGEHTLKGVPGMWELFSVTGGSERVT